MMDKAEEKYYSNETKCRNANFNRFVGYQDIDNEYLRYMFSDENVNELSNEISGYLEGVVPGRKIIVPNKTILDMLNDCYINYRFPTSDIYGRYNIPNDMNGFIQDITDETIEIITSTVRCNLEMEQQNVKLTIWDTVLGDFNAQGLRQHAPIKIRERRPTPMQFNMNY